MLPSSISKNLAAASSNNIALSQALGGAGNLTLNGSTVAAGVATLDTQRRVIITSAGNDSGINWTVTGTDDTGNSVSDTFAGGNVAAAQSNRDFLTVSKIAGSGAAAGNVTAGTNGVGSSPWKSLSTQKTPANASVAVIVSGVAVNYTVEYTYDAYWNLPSGVTLPGIFPVQTLSGQTINGEGTLPWPTAGVRLTINSGTGTARMTVTDAGIAGA